MMKQGFVFPVLVPLLLLLLLRGTRVHDTLQYHSSIALMPVHSLSVLKLGEIGEGKE